MYLHFLKTLILKFQEKHQISYWFKPGETFDRKLPRERINGRYTNAEYRGKITRCDLTLNTGPYAGACGGAFAPPLAGLIISKSWRFLPETEFTPLMLASQSAPPFVKPLNSHPLFKSLRTGLK